MSTAELSRSTATFVLPAAHIAGQPVRTPADAPGAPIFDASTGAAIGWQEFATAAHVDAAVRAARDAFAGWRDTPPAERGRILAKIAERVEASRDRLAALQMQVSGKPPFEADADVGDVAATFAYYAKLCEDPALFTAEPVALPSDAVTAERFYDSVGVAALVMPWNFPMVTTAWKLAPALAAGCAVVLKPSELTSPTEHALLDLVAEGGVPAGVVNVVNGGAEVGAALTAHPLIDKISFTGSTAAGRKVMQAAAVDMKRVTLELGGKSSLIVRDDADLDVAVSLAVAGAFTNAGQMCSATARILVHDSVYRSFMAPFETAVRASSRAGRGTRRDGAADLGRAAYARRSDAPARHRCGRTRRLQRPRGGCRRRRLLHGACRDRRAGRRQPAVDRRSVRPRRVREIVPHRRRSDRARERHALRRRDRRDARCGYREAIPAARARAVWINAPQLIYPHVCWGGFASGIGRELGVAGLRSYQELRHAMRAID